MPIAVSGRNAAVDGLAAVITHVSALSDLGTTESSSARTAVSWNASSGGVKDNTAQLSIAMPAGSTAVAIGLHSASTAGTQHGWLQIGSTLRGAGTVVSTAGDAISSNGHGLANTNRVFFTTVAGESLPSGLSNSVLYFVVGAATDSFQVSLTSGGAAVDITALGDVAWYRTIPETFGSAGNLIVAAGALDLDAGFIA
jgi:hypothetical protein